MEWSSESDWNFPSQNGYITFDSGAVVLEDMVDYFEEYPSGEVAPNPWTVEKGGGLIATDQSYSGSQSFKFGTDIASHSGTIEVLAYATDLAASQYSEYTVVYRETSNNNGHYVRLLDSSGNSVLIAGTSNPQADVVGGNGSVSIESAPSPGYDAWRRFTFTFDWANSTYDVLWEDLTGDTADRTASGVPFINSNASDVQREEVVQDDANLSSSGGSLDGWIENMGPSAVLNDTIKGVVKSFSDSTIDSLVTVSGSNGGGRIDLEVVASPGESDEERWTRSIKTESRYEIEWSNKHSNFQVSLTMINGTINKPLVDYVNLQKRVSIGSEIIGENIFSMSENWYSEAGVGI